MKKRFLVSVLLIITMLATLAGCGGSKKTSGPSGNVDENGVVTSVTYVCTLSRAAFVMVIR